MANITVNPLVSTDALSILTGSVRLDRTKGETINVVFNYETYKLFEGNLGLDEFPVATTTTSQAAPPTETTGTWKLHLSDPIPFGVYDVEAYVLDADGRIIASDETENEVTIYLDPGSSGGSNQQSLSQKVNKLAALMAAFNMLSMAAQSAFNSKGVHPTTNDDASTHLHGRGKEEAAKSAEEKDRKKKKVKKVPVPVKPKNKATKNGEESDPNVIDPDGAPGFQGEAGTALAAALNRGNPESAGSSLEDATAAIRNAPDLSQELIYRNPGGTTTPTTPFG